MTQYVYHDTSAKYKLYTNIQYKKANTTWMTHLQNTNYIQIYKYKKGKYTYSDISKK